MPAEQENAAITAVVAADAPATTSQEPTSHRRIATAAAILMLGQLLSSVLGMVRSEVINIFFYGIVSGAFLLAFKPVQMLSTLIISGDSVSGALIPTFVDYSAPEQRDELRRIYSTILSLVVLAMAAATLVLCLLAPVIVPFLAPTSRFSAAGQRLAIQLVPLTAFSLFGLGLYAAASAVLYALKKVVYPAFATGIQHVGVVLIGVGALLFAAHQAGIPFGALFHHGGGASAASSLTDVYLVGARGLAFGIVLGSLGEFVLLLPGLRGARVHWRPVLDLRHPAVRHILKLYLPVVAGLVLTVAYTFFDLFLQGHTPGGAAENITSLASATTLIQFPVGLVAATLSFAVLPPLTAAATQGNMREYKRTLALGIRLGLLLMVPAMVGLIVLREPILMLLFQHGNCGHGCTVRNALALQNYAYELPFIAVDQILIAAFYARKNTMTPTIIGVVSIGFYLIAALPFATSVGMPALAFGDTAKNSGHAIVLFILLSLTVGNLGWRELASGTLRICLAAGAMGAACWGLLLVLPRTLPALFTQGHLGGELATVIVIGAVGAGLYFALVHLLGVEEVRLLSGIVRKRLGLGGAA